LLLCIFLVSNLETASRERLIFPLHTKKKSLQWYIYIFFCFLLPSPWRP